MLNRDLARVVHEDRLRDAQERRDRFTTVLERQHKRAETRARRRRMRQLRREAHRATVGAFVAFGDGVAGHSGDSEAKSRMTLSGRR